MFRLTRFSAYIWTLSLKPSPQCRRLSTLAPPEGNEGKQGIHETTPDEASVEGVTADVNSPGASGQNKWWPSATDEISLKHADLLKAFGLASIPQSDDTGVEINKLGQIRITNEEQSQQKHKTALVLSRAPACLDERDFVSILGPGKYLRQWRAARGLEKIIPMRFHDTLRRSNTWILIFSSPASAKEFQDKVHRLHKFARDNLPTSPLTKIVPPPNFSAGGAHQHRLSDYTLTAPWLRLSLVAHLAPFNDKIQDAIDLHKSLASKRIDGKAGFPVRLWLENQYLFTLKKEYVRRLLVWDGQNRRTPWQLIEDKDTITSLSGPFSNEMLTPDEDEVLGRGENWRIAFQSAAEAKRFVRTWHRSVFPRLDSLLNYPDPPPIIKAECLFEGDIF
ncbi:uncharacterized protein PADG_00283 [Paracoccidioides brasiliensis Pb18]|uniref:Uncharacterized protein n=2 Tax=Paracoccidioides brasiliensis TaxID=121759 RepID=C1G093_PARBD|nr:uncharacterized protein PADG_00283 [Paracoccidioides brasiliensis Pb18]EEH43994.2 hypothetical protein PADG_00283 [Paracoccidioides brasiliensis Pb18]ODH19911.1 hypothetical protein ACO22_06050 [Paracoccidioides brasiliensis]